LLGFGASAGRQRGVGRHPLEDIEVQVHFGSPMLRILPQGPQHPGQGWQQRAVDGGQATQRFRFASVFQGEGLLGQFLDLPLVTIAAVHGQCLGGGFELVLACDFIIAEEGAAFACPEIKLAVFPPAAAVLLPVRIGASRAAELVLTGAAWTASQAAAAGLVVRTAPAGQLETTVDAWIRDHFRPRSAAALRHAVRATRLPLQRALHEDLPQLERIYLEDLMAEPDALEGLRAFLEKRLPSWAKRGMVA